MCLVCASKESYPIPTILDVAFDAAASRTKLSVIGKQVMQHMMKDGSATQGACIGYLHPNPILHGDLPDADISEL